MAIVARANTLPIGVFPTICLLLSVDKTISKSIIYLLRPFVDVYGHFGCSIPVDRIRISIWCVALVSVCSGAKYQLCVSAKHIPTPTTTTTTKQRCRLKSFTWVKQNCIYCLFPLAFFRSSQRKKKQLGQFFSGKLLFKKSPSKSLIRALFLVQKPPREKKSVCYMLSQNRCQLMRDDVGQSER